MNKPMDFNTEQYLVGVLEFFDRVIDIGELDQVVRDTTCVMYGRISCLLKRNLQPTEMENIELRALYDSLTEIYANGYNPKEFTFEELYQWKHSDLVDACMEIVTMNGTLDEGTHFDEWKTNDLIDFILSKGK